MELSGRALVGTAGLVSGCLVLGVQTDGGVVVLRPERAVPDGTEVF